MSSKASIILGIDPGLVKTGWGIVLKEKYNAIKYIDCGVIRTDSKESMEIRLVSIFDQVSKLILEFNPEAVSMEEVFVNMNPKTSEKLIMARTASFLAISKLGLKVNQYKPNEIKKNITGSGHASKEQVYIMIQKILGKNIINDNKTKTFDSMDALAIATCHAFSKGAFSGIV